MKILICSAPKSGNTWLNNILMSIYRLVPLTIGRNANFDEILQAGDNWVTYTHSMPDQLTIRMLKESGVKLVSIVRHPGDQLVSMVNFSKWYFDKNDPEALLIGDASVDSSDLLAYARSIHTKNLQVTMLWDSCGSIVIKYEDLYYNPMDTLRLLTQKISPVDDSDIIRGVAMASPEISQGLRWVKKQFIVENGIPGKWIKLHKLVVDYVKVSPFYKNYCDRYGYGFELEQNWQSDRHENFNFFSNLASHFDNGVDFHPVLKSIYINNTPEFKTKFDEPYLTGPGTFYEWLNLGVAGLDDCPRSGNRLQMTNLMHEVYKLRVDLQRAFPDVHGEDAARYFQWFIDFSHYQVGIPDTFVMKVWDNYIRHLAART